jgi:hypothetical protein
MLRRQKPSRVTRAMTNAIAGVIVARILWRMRRA